jgi:alcohol dehydrogenase, propanol-preferring
MQGWALDGFMQEYCIVDHKTAFVLPEDLDATKAAPLTCAGITAFNAVRRPGLKEGQWLGVVGCGGLGQLAVRYAKAHNLRVIAIDIDNTILSHATAAGVEHTFNSRTTRTPDLITTIKSLTGGGLHAVAVFTAVKAGYAIAPKLLRLGGQLVCVGCPGEDVEINAMSVALSMYSVVGANNMATPSQLRECAEFTAKHGIDPPMQFFKIEQIEEMVEIMEKGKLGGNRLVVQY